MAGLAPQIADARAAFALIRKRSAEWHVDPDRIGVTGAVMPSSASASAAPSASEAVIMLW